MLEDKTDQKSSWSTEKSNFLNSEFTSFFSLKGSYSD